MSEKNIIPLTLRIHDQIKNELMNDPKQVAIKAIRLWESIKH